MVARSDSAQASLQAQLKARRVKKTYLALVAGSVSAAAGRIEAPIGRDPGRRTRMAAGLVRVVDQRIRERRGRRDGKRRRRCGEQRGSEKAIS